MVLPPGTLTPTPKTLIGGSVLLLGVAAIFAVLNLSRVISLRSLAVQDVAARETDEANRTKESELKARESAIAAEEARLAERDTKTMASEERFAKILDEKKELETKLQDKETEIAALQKQIDDNEPPTANPGAPSTVELQAQLDDARQQLDNAEREKIVLAEKFQSARQRSVQMEDEKNRRTIARGKMGIHGSILAVNQAYNFVVLNLGGRNGVEPHSEMFIVRDGTFIGKILISSVEPTTAIGDIISSSLARGVQVQPGDVVIYAGSNS